MDLFPLQVFYYTYYISKKFKLVVVTSQFIFAIDNNNEPSMLVHTGPDSAVKFYQCCEVLY